MDGKRIVIVVRERPGSRLFRALQTRQKRIRIKGKPAPRVGDTGKAQRKIDRGFVAKALGADDWLNINLVDLAFTADDGLLHIVMKPGIRCLGSPDYSVEFGDDEGVKSFLGRDIVVRVYEEATFRQLWPEEK